MIEIIAAVVLLPGLLAAVTVAAHWCGGLVIAVLQLLLPWWTIVTVGVLAIAITTRSWWLAATAAVIAVGQTAILIPKLMRSRRRSPASTESATAFTIGLANLYLDNEEADEAIAQLLDAGPDILVMTELTTELMERFDGIGGRERYPHRIHREPLRGEYEAGIFSGRAFADEGVHEHGELRVVEACLSVPGGSVRIIVAHPDAPTDRAGFRRWGMQLAALRELLLDADPATIALGDLNAGTLQAPYEALLTTPFRDAHDVLGSALRPSWGIAPGLPRWVPTLLARLDHLLIGPAVDVIELSDLDPVGSDHRPFLATLSVRPSH